MDYSSVMETILKFSEENENIRAVVLTGSAASGAVHSLSDRDLELHALDTSLLEQDDSWWDSLGDVLVVERLKNSVGQATCLAYYVGGKIDFTLVSIHDVRGVYDRPFEVLLDKDGVTSDFRVVTPPAELPDQERFDQCVNWAYAAALMLAKAIVRDEPWSVKVRDYDLKAELLRMIEWDHRIRYGGSRDVRYLGARMRLWMDIDIQERLEQCWAAYNLTDSGSALRESLDLFQAVASRVASIRKLNDFDHEAVRLEIGNIFNITAV